MIPLEVILALLDKLRSEAIEDVERAIDRDAFAFGQINGRLKELANFREHLNTLIEESNED